MRGHSQPLNTECRSPGWKQLAVGKDVHWQAVRKGLGLQIPKPFLLTVFLVLDVVTVPASKGKMLAAVRT